MNEVKIAVPGEKRISLVIPAPGLDGRAPNVIIQWEGFAGANETMVRMEVIQWLLVVVGSLVQTEYNGAVPPQMLAPLTGNTM